MISCKFLGIIVLSNIVLFQKLINSKNRVIKPVVFFITILINPHSTDFFLSYFISVILGIKNVGDFPYLETIHNSHSEIIIPILLLMLFGSLLTLILNTIYLYNRKPVLWLVLAALIIYIVGTYGFTSFENVPLYHEWTLLEIDKVNGV